jgi:pSer/pThr/pTyr-binding forkhead associated (FHA) protein
MSDLKLVVLAGAKEGTQIPLKKDKFIIGRSSECTLRAASEAISRRHCAILRTKDGWMARDLGSRNGTYLNDQRIESPTRLSAGDELRIGPLKFRVDAMAKPDAESASGGRASPAAETDRATKSDLPHDLKRAKKPPVKDVADAARREADKQDSTATEDDISRWLLGAVDSSDTNMMRETQTLSMEDTTSISRSTPVQPIRQSDDEQDIVVKDEADQEPTDSTEESSTDEKTDGSGGWKLFGLGKIRAAKKKPGKLPKRPEQPSKDSREAAADILREMTRRR